jgi:iron complex outermembrane receptor protein
VIVTGISGSSSIRKSPVPVTRISRAELIAIPATNLIDALSHQAGISQVSTGPAISKPVIRGLGYNRLVVVNDGVRQEGQQWGDEHGIEIDENNISRIEILKGPASLMYGSDAMAGVINILSTIPLPNHTISGNILSSYQTNNHQRSLFANLGGNLNGFNWNAWGDIKAASDYKNSYDGTVYNSKYREQNVGGYIGYNGNWGFSHLIVSNFNQKPGIIEGARNELGQFIKPLPGGDEGIPSEQDFTSTEAQVPWQHVNHFKVIADNRFQLSKGNITLNLGWQRNNRKEFGNVDEPSDPTLSFNLTTFNYKAIYHRDNHTGWNSSFGISGMQQVNRIGGEELLIPEYQLFDAGAFVYAQKTLNKFTISGGTRYDIRDLKTTQLMEGNEIKFPGLKQNYSNLSASAGMTFEASDALSLKLNLAKGFRAPGIPELASNGAHEGTNRYEYGNPDMKSESSWQADAGMEFNSDHIFFSATTFYNHIDNFIFYSKLTSLNGGDSLILNEGDLIPTYQFDQRTANLYGIELQIDVHPHPLDWLHWENNFSYVRGKFAEPVDGTDNLPLIPAAHWLSELRGEFLKKGKIIRNLSIYTDLDITFAQHDAFTGYQTETETPGYTLFNAGISGSLMRKNTSFITFYLSGINLTDVAYQSHLSRLKYTDVNQVSGRKGVYNMGRNFMFKVNIPIQLFK